MSSISLRKNETMQKMHCILAGFSVLWLVSNLDSTLLMARTNKRGIAAKKAQLQKQAGNMKGVQRFTYPKRKIGESEAKDLGVIGAQTNPKGNTYNWFLKGRKICWETRLRVDPDGFRYIRTPSGGSDFVEVPISGWLRKRLSKSTARGY